MKPKPATEAAVQKRCLKWLDLAERSGRLVAWRQNNGAVRGRRFHGRAGVPDILVVIRGRLLGVECKSPTGRLSPAQETFRDALADAGARYVVARDLADLVKAVRELEEKADA